MEAGRPAASQEEALRVRAGSSRNGEDSDASFVCLTASKTILLFLLST